jgi:hypothetical protein
MIRLSALRVWVRSVGCSDRFLAAVSEQAPIPAALRVSELRIKRKTKETSLVKIAIQANKSVSQVEERLGRELSSLDDTHQPGLINHKKSPALIWSSYELNR